MHVQRLYELLLQDGFEPRVLSLGALRSGDLYPLQFGRSYIPTNFMTVGRVVGRGGILHNHSVVTSYPSREMLEPLLFATKLWRIRWVESFHDQTIIYRFAEFPDQARRLFMRAMTNAAKIIASGEAIFDFLLSVGVPAAKVVVGQPLLPLRAERRPLTERWAQFFADHAPVWITIGAFTPLYDFATVARAFRRALETEPDAGLAIVSGSFAVDELYEREVRSLLSDLGERVIFGEDVPNSEVDAMLRSATLLIRGPRHESFGLSRIEAILAGTPVVATDTGQTDFMTLYRYGDADSLLGAARRAVRAAAGTLEAAATYYREMASQSFEVILDVYEELGVTPELRDGRG
jgi:glycosyltransferase involved in cell wall biosynthesis